LFTNNVTPSETDTIGTYNESVVAGYTPKTLTGTSWTFSTTNGTSSAIYATQTFTFSTSDNIYGCYVTDVSDTNLLWADRFDGVPYTIPTTGGVVQVDPQVSLE
jgi:hypothetical protein